MALIIKNRRVTVQLVDGTADTPKGAYLKFRGDFSGPHNRGRCEEVLEMSNEKADTDIHWNIVTDRPIFEPLEISMSGKMEETYIMTGFLEFLSNPDDEVTWAALGTSLTGVTSIGAIVNADGTSVNFPLPKDAHRAAHLVNTEMRYDGASADGGRKYMGCFFEGNGIDLSVSEGGDMTWKAKGTVYGAVAAITALTTIAEIAA